MQGSDTGKKLFKKLAGESGEEFMNISTTIGNVATGVLGVAILQTTLLGLVLSAIILSLSYKLYLSWISYE